MFTVIIMWFRNSMLVSHCEIPVYAMYKFDCISTKKRTRAGVFSSTVCKFVMP